MPSRNPKCQGLDSSGTPAAAAAAAGAGATTLHRLNSLVYNRQPAGWEQQAEGTGSTQWVPYNWDVFQGQHTQALGQQVPGRQRAGVTVYSAGSVGAASGRGRMVAYQKKGDGWAWRRGGNGAQ